MAAAMVLRRPFRLVSPSTIRPAGRRGWIVLAVLLLLAVMCWHRPARQEAGVAVATFNVRDFPADGWQLVGTFETIADLHVPIVGLQELTKPAVFAAAAADFLGPDWGFVADASTSQKLHLGLLYDDTRFELLDVRTHDDTTLGGEYRPTLRVDLRRRSDDRLVQVFVVHLKGLPGNEKIRRRQLRALDDLVADATRPDADVYVVGDFNAISDRDRAALRTFATHTELTWTSADLPCTAYWRPKGETRCRGAALDHVFASTPATAIARGPCEELGCNPEKGCPAFHELVSDHCPVVATP